MTQIKIVPLLHLNDKNLTDRWKLVQNGKEIGRYATIYQAHVIAEQLFGIIRWRHDPNTSGYTAME